MASGSGIWTAISLKFFFFCILNFVILFRRWNCPISDNKWCWLSMWQSDGTITNTTNWWPLRSFRGRRWRRGQEVGQVWQALNWFRVLHDDKYFFSTVQSVFYLFIFSWFFWKDRLWCHMLNRQLFQCHFIASCIYIDCLHVLWKLWNDWRTSLHTVSWN